VNQTSDHKGLGLRSWFLRYSFATILLASRDWRGFSCGNSHSYFRRTNIAIPVPPDFIQDETNSYAEEYFMKLFRLSLAALLLTAPAFSQQNPAPPIYPAPGNAADAQSQ